MSRPLRVLAVALAALSTAALVASLTPAGGGASLWKAGMAWGVPNIVVGALLTYRRPHLLTGWLFAIIGFLVSSGAVAEAAAHAGLSAGAGVPWWGVLGAWYGEWYWLPMIYVTLIFLPLTFPDGRAPTPAFVRPMITTVFALGIVTILAALQEHLDVPNPTPTTPRIPNPIGIQGLEDVEVGIAAAGLLVVTLAGLVTTFVGVVTRYRRSQATERQQLKWFTSAVAVLIVGFVLHGVLDAALHLRLEAFLVGLFALPPIAAAVGIFRYRLYAIDRIISRTVTYALVSALLVMVYVGAVALMSAAVDPVAGGSPFAVATATLAAAAVFRPARRRIQTAVDTRFNRARYNAEQMLVGFRERVRSNVDLERLCADLVSVTDVALQPRTAVIWLQGRGQE